MGGFDTTIPSNTHGDIGRAKKSDKRIIVDVDSALRAREGNAINASRGGNFIQKRMYLLPFYWKLSCSLHVKTACHREEQICPEVIFFSCSAHLSMKFFLLTNVKMPTINGILTFMNRKIAFQADMILKNADLFIFSYL